MDRTAWIVVTLCALGLGWLMISQQNQIAEQQARAAEEARIQAESETTGELRVGDDSAADPSSLADSAETSAEAADLTPASTEKLPLAEGVSLEVNEVKYLFTPKGGGIAKAEMLTDPNTAPGLTAGERIERRDLADKVTLNRFGRHAIGALSPAEGKFEQANYELTQVSEREVQARGVLNNGIEVVKTWTIPEGELTEKSLGHLIQLKVEFFAKDGQTLETDGYSVGLGSVAALNEKELPTHTGIAWQDGGKHEFEHVNWFKGGKFLWMVETRAPSEFMFQSINNWWWTGLTNQFYTTMLSPHEGNAENRGEFWARRFPVSLGDGQQDNFAIEAAASLGRLQLQGGSSQSFTFDYYLGPKKYSLLKDLGEAYPASFEEHSEVLDYGGLPVFGWMASPFSKLLNLGMNMAEGWFGNAAMRFAFAIILLTLFIRTLMWPLHARAQMTMKRMAKLKPKMDELKEKYKDDPQKMQQENMKLMSTYGVNPLGGCLPMLLQMPIFLGFYRMLFFAAELRHEPFLWVQDLSQPDTIGYIFGIPINPLPLVMSAFSLLQLKLTPKTGDPTQRRIMYIMPAVMLIFCYGFASALALYWTISNIFTIVQMLIMQRMPEPELKKKKGGGKTFAEKLQDMQAQRQQMMAAQQGRQPAKKKKSSRPRTGG